MRVFISWSGQSSNQIAGILHEFIPVVLQYAKPYMSSEDIVSGNRWGADIASQLSDTNYGIACLTPGNLKSEWVHFEAGALSKVLGGSYFCPLLHGVQKSQISSPLVQFQAKMLSEEDLLSLFIDMNKCSEAHCIDEAVVRKSFAAQWPEIHSRIKQVGMDDGEPVVGPPEDPNRQILEQILETSRATQRMMREKPGMSAFASSAEINLLASVNNNSLLQNIYHEVGVMGPLLRMLQMMKLSYDLSEDERAGVDMLWKSYSRICKMFEAGGIAANRSKTMRDHFREDVRDFLSREEFRLSDKEDILSLLYKRVEALAQVTGDSAVLDRIGPELRIIFEEEFVRRVAAVQEEQ